MIVLIELNQLTVSDAARSWPPPDPDRMPRQLGPANNQAFLYQDDSRSSREQLEAFRLRQEEDLKRFHHPETALRRRPFHERYKHASSEESERTKISDSNDELGGGEEGWRDSEGDRLADFGVDEEIEFYDEDDTPLAQLLVRQRAKSR